MRHEDAQDDAAAAAMLDALERDSSHKRQW
jgi:hypothetical protein